jgi:hypothetical protein
LCNVIFFNKFVSYFVSNLLFYCVWVILILIKNLHVALWISKNRSKLNRIYLDRIGSDLFNIIIQTKPNRTRFLFWIGWFFTSKPIQTGPRTPLAIMLRVISKWHHTMKLCCFSLKKKKSYYETGIRSFDGYDTDKLR